MASIYDITFLRLLMQKQLAEKPQAMRCLQVIDEQAQRGQSVTALQVVVQMGMLDAEQARQVDALAREEISRGQQGVVQSTAGSTSGAFRPQGPGPSSGSFPSGAPLPGMPGEPPPLPSSTSSVAAPPLPGALPPLPGSRTPSGGVHRGTPPQGVPAPRPGTPPQGVPPSAGTPVRGVPGPPPALPGAPGETPPLGVPQAAADEWYDLAEQGEGLDAYECGAKLGRGPVGATYRGRRKADGSPVVVKVISRRFQQHEQVLGQLIDDVLPWVELQHPNLAALEAMGVSNGRRVLVFEQARGRPLSAWLEEGPLQPRQALRVVYDVAHALAAARAEAERSHGDVRSAKVFYDGERAQLVDGGLARSSCLGAGFGQHGVGFGHPAYLAPEVIQERLEEPTDASDVYALGVLFYELVCGVPPFQGEPVEVLRKHFDAPLPPPPQDVTFSPTIAALMLRMTAKSPGQRIPDAAAVVTVITQLLEGKPVSLPAPKEAQPITRDDWEGESQKEASGAGGWSETRIVRAASVGPDDMDVLHSDVSAVPLSAQMSGKLPRELTEAAVASAKVKLGEKLGRGSVGAAHEGTLAGHPDPVVIKVLSKKYGKVADLVPRILERARAAKGLTHPNVVATIDVLAGVAGRELIVFERVSGQTLRGTLEEKGPLLASSATERVLDVARALQAAAGRGLSHGDLRPEKVFIDAAGDARLADFGLAEAACIGAGYGRYGLRFGHPDYLAPEVLQEGKNEPDTFSDIYALGCLYYELICARPPFRAEDVKQTLIGHFKSPPPPPPEGVSVPGAVAQLILRMTAKDPSRRIASWDEVIEALEQCRGLDGSGRVEELPSVDELEPDGDWDMGVSAAMWESVSEPLSKPSGEWDKERIGKEKVGPEEWSPLDSEADMDADGGSPLAAAVAQAGGPGDDAPAPKRRGAAPDAKVAGRAAQQAAVAAAAASPKAGAKKGKKKGGGGNKAQLVVAVVGLLGIVAVMGYLATRGDDTEGPGPTPTPTQAASVTPTTPTPSPTPDADRQRLENQLRNVELDVQNYLASQRFKDAMAAMGEFTREERALGFVGQKLQELEDEVRAGHAQKLTELQRRIDEAVQREAFDEALRLAGGAASWSLDEAVVENLKRGVIEKRQAHHQAIEVLGETELSRGAVEAQLRGNLRGWGGASILFPKGGVVLQYGSGNIQALPDDLLLLKGVPPSLASVPGGGGQGLKVVGGGDEPTIVAVKLPLARLVDAKVDLVVGEGPSGTPRVALLGALPREGRRMKGYGTLWGQAPVDYDRREGLRTILSVPIDPVKPLTPLRLRLTISGQHAAVKAGGSFNDLAAGTKVEGTAAAPRGISGSDGYFGLYVENAEVYVTGLEVRGLLDPEKLE